MLHAITGNRDSVQRSIRNAINAFEQNNVAVQHRLRVRGGLSESQQDILRRAIVSELAKAATAADLENEVESFYVSQNSTIALLQSAMNAAIERNAVVMPSTTSAPFEQFGPLDPGWIECLVDAFQTLFLGKATFIQHQRIDDFVVDVPDHCTMALIADWGAYDSAAMAVASQIRAAKPDICIHLGDIYYAGQRNEAEAFLGLWPMAESGTRQIPLNTSFAMNGNHEMYSGGRPFFNFVLAAFGQQASYFGLRNNYWQFMGLDTAYIDHRLLDPQKASQLEFPERLVGSQWTWLEDKVLKAGSRKTVFLTHHQPVSAFQPEQDRAANLRADYTSFTAAVGGKAPFAWFFGHEHKCTIYDDAATGFRARLIGNGCIPHLPPPNDYHLPKHCTPFTLMNLRRNAIGDAVSGFALLHLAGSAMSIRYINEDGSTFYEEQWNTP